MDEQPEDVSKEILSWGVETGEGERHHQSIPSRPYPVNQGKKPSNQG